MIKKNSPAKLGSLQKLYLAVLRLHFLSHLTVLNYFTVKFNHDFTIYNERFPKKPSRLQASQVSVVRLLFIILFFNRFVKNYFLSFTSSRNSFFEKLVACSTVYLVSNKTAFGISITICIFPSFHCSLGSHFL